MKIYNALTRKIEEFRPLTPGKVLAYVCGITPYDTTHLGHAFTYVSFDALFRYLRHKGYSVTYVQNVTDIDDDILKRAKENNENWQELGEFWTKKFLADMEALNVEMPTHYVKATDAIDTIITITQALLKQGIAYENGGTVFYSVTKDPEYGKLSRLTREQMLLLSKERGNDPADKRKQDPLDFILWQHSKPDEPSWASPWGGGRPGWHIECSSMIRQSLDEQIDIHGGGRDLIFPHHESEIAQSESYTGKKPFVRFWVHTAMVMYDGEKMAKSLGNLVMISDLLPKYEPDAIRWYLLSHHYRDVWEHRDDDLAKCAARYRAVKEIIGETSASAGTVDIPCDTFCRFMDEDFDTPSALEYIYRQALHSNSEQGPHAKERQILRIRRCMEILGFAL